MKAVILAGGKGTRISEESILRPKPMITIGGMPILWHIMKIYSAYGIQEFIICCGYKGQYIKEYFMNYHAYCSNAEILLGKSQSHRPDITYFRNDNIEPWKVILADTGLNTLTAGRILKIKDYIQDDEDFMLTYGDGVADVNITELLKFHNEHKKIVTISTTQPEGRFGAVKIDEDDTIESFKEKARRNQSFVNMGFMVMNRKVFDYLGDGSEMLEAGPFETLAADREMAAYKHNGFWSPMDNIHDREYLEKLWGKGNAPWYIW